MFRLEIQIFFFVKFVIICSVSQVNKVDENRNDLEQEPQCFASLVKAWLHYNTCVKNHIIYCFKYGQKDVMSQSNSSLLQARD